MNIYNKFHTKFCIILPLMVLSTTIFSQSPNYIKGEQDASKNYPVKNTGAGWTATTVAFLTPLIGIIPAIVCSKTEPSVENLNIPNTELQYDSDYQNGYKHEARKMKAKKIWTSYAISSVTYIVISSITISIDN